MNKKTFLAMVLGLVMSFGASAAELKIGYVDLQKALQDTSAGKKAKAELEVEFKKKKKALEAKEADLKTKREDIQKKKDLLSEVALQQKAAEFQQEMLKYRDQLQKSQLEIQKRERELTAPLINALGKVIDEIAKKEGYDMILEKSQQGIVWAKEDMDLTAKVVQTFEKKKK